MIPNFTTIYRGKPFAYVLDSKMRLERCDNCLKRQEIFKCSRCMYTSYCDRTCQEESWPVHISECANLKKWAQETSEQLPNLIRLTARIISKIATEEVNEKDYYTDTEHMSFKDLKSLSENTKNRAVVKEQFEAFRAVLKKFMPESGKLGEGELWEIYGKVTMNNISLGDMASFECTGIGVYLGISFLPHSCAPTAKYINDGTTLILVTVQNLPELDWEKISIPYIPISETKEKRRQLLQERYFFWCLCVKCTRPEPLAACPNKVCLNFCEPEDKECSSCKEKFPEGFKQEYDEVSRLTSEFFKVVHDDNVDGEFVITAALESCLKLQIMFFHRYNTQHLRTLKLTFIMIQNSCYRDVIMQSSPAAYPILLTLPANEIMSRIIEGYIAHLGHDDLYIAKLYFQLAQMHFRSGCSEEGAAMVFRASYIMDISYGRQNSHLLEERKQLYKRFVH